MRNKIYFLLIIIPLLLTACQGNKQQAADGKEGDTVHLKYSENISIVKFNDHTEVKLNDPWNKGKTLHTYILVDKSKKDGYDKAPDGATVVGIPLSHSLIATSVHAELAKKLGKENILAGAFDVDYMNSTWIKQRLKENKTTNCGNSTQPNIERIIALSPDAIFISPMQNSGGYGKLENLGLPIVELADYMETTALGRAEWVKFYGLLWGAEKQADSLFSNTEKEYMRLKDLAKKAKYSPSVMMDKVENGVWYLPGGKSTISQTIYDANAKYTYAADKSSGSIQKSLESVIDDNAGADVWLLRYYKADNSPLTLRGLASESSSYTILKAYKSGRVYGCNTAATSFFKDIPFEPHLLLRDFILAFHPEMATIIGEPKYFFKLER